MKKKVISILIVLIVLAGACFYAYYASGNSFSYFDNYAENFKRNVNALVQRFDIQLPEPVENFLTATPEPTEDPVIAAILRGETPPPDGILGDSDAAGADPSATPAETATPIPTPKPEKSSLVSSVPVALENAGTAQYARYKGDILCATQTTLTAYDHNGKAAWQVNIHASQPILRTAGSYILIAEKGGKRVELYKGQKRVFSLDSPDEIEIASVSSRGDVVLVTKKLYYKGSVAVYNKNGEEVYRWNSGTFNILDASVSPGGRRLAVSLLNTDNGADSRILFFKLDQADSYKTVDLEKVIAFDLEFYGETLNVYTDTKILGISTGGNISWTYDFGGRTLTHYAAEDNGNKLCIFDNNNAAEAVVLSAGGRVRSTVKSDVLPDFADADSGCIAYNNGRNLIFSSRSGRTQASYTCSRDIQKAYIFDSSHVLLVYNSSLEFVKLARR